MAKLDELKVGQRIRTIVDVGNGSPYNPHIPAGMEGVIQKVGSELTNMPYPVTVICDCEFKDDENNVHKFLVFDPHELEVISND